MDSSQPVIDMWAPVLPTREIMGHMEKEFPPATLSYFAVFQGHTFTMEEFSAYARVLTENDDVIMHGLDKANISKVVVTGFDEKTTAEAVFVPNEAVAAIAEREPDRVIPFAGVDIMRGAEAVRELEHWIDDRGFRGLSLRPFMFGEPASDRRYYPFYEKCVEFDIPCSMHASANWARTRPSDLGHPRHFDAVACDFPDLKLIMSHAGYPWVLEACLTAWKHPNVYLEIAAHRPKYFTAPGAGWEPLMRFGQSTIQDKVLYGTGAFLIGRQPAELLKEFHALPLRDGIKEKWLYSNAAALLGEPPAS